MGSHPLFFHAKRPASMDVEKGPIQEYTACQQQQFLQQLGLPPDQSRQKPGVCEMPHTNMMQRTQQIKCLQERAKRTLCRAVKRATARQTETITAHLACNISVWTAPGIKLIDFATPKSKAIRTTQSPNIRQMIRRMVFPMVVFSLRYPPIKKSRTFQPVEVCMRYSSV